MTSIISNCNFIVRKNGVTFFLYLFIYRQNESGDSDGRHRTTAIYLIPIVQPSISPNSGRLHRSLLYIVPTWALSALMGADLRCFRRKPVAFDRHCSSAFCSCRARALLPLRNSETAGSRCLMRFLVSLCPLLLLFLAINLSLSCTRLLP